MTAAEAARLIEAVTEVQALVAEVRRAKDILDPQGVHHGIEDAARNAAQVIVSQAGTIERLRHQLALNYEGDRP